MQQVENSLIVSFVVATFVHLSAIQDGEVQIRMLLKLTYLHKGKFLP